MNKFLRQISKTIMVYYVSEYNIKAFVL